MSAPTRRFSESPRLRNFDYRGNHAYHLTIVTDDRRPVLVDMSDLIRRALAQAGEATSFEVLVYTIMPDHLHVLAAGLTPDASLVRFMQRFKQATGYVFKQQSGKKLWQRSYHDHVLRRAEDVKETGTYILGNPVRAALVHAWEDWPHCGGSLIDHEGWKAHT